MTNYNLDPASPPPPANYRVTFTYDSQGGQHFNQGRGKLTCTECDEILDVVYEAAEVNDRKAHGELTTKHNAKKHPGLLYVFTSAGWCQLKYLIPDPVASINDAIDKSAREQGHAQKRCT